MFSLITAMLLGYVTALLVVFIDFTFNSGNIFDFYYKFIIRKVEPLSEKLAKPLGTCPVCMGFWIGLGVFFTMAPELGLSLEYLIPFVGVNAYTTMRHFKLF